ncbi:MAG TPA: GTPase Era [Candidatus Kapabacteria bacterium]|nr:GTPase Era [Candidatus Kapabacteria bacterium]
MAQKCGFVSIIGKPNEGKSTLMNAIIGAKLSITTAKPQTTRKRILGIYTENDVQIVFTDTPGIIRPKYELQKKMMDYVDESIRESDLIIYLLSADILIKKDIPEYMLEMLKEYPNKKIAVINKMDAIDNKKDVLPFIAKMHSLGIFEDVVPISALYNDNVSRLVEVIASKLPEQPFVYEEDLLSTQNQRFFVSEIIRETVFEEFKEEIPYSTDVQITEYKERNNGKWFIAADIIIEKTSQKKIIIGEKGSGIKKIGALSRPKIEEHLGMEVYLELFVKVRDKWRDSKSKLKFMGY